MVRVPVVVDNDNLSTLETTEIVDPKGEQEAPAMTVEDPHPLGNLIRICGSGNEGREYYEAFSYDGNLFSLGDPVFLAPEEPNQKPGMAIIKGIAETPDQKVIVTGQMFYRPEEAQRRDLGCWKPRFKGEVFYSFHQEEFPAERVMHKFVVHFIPQNKQIPPRKLYPGLVAQKIYDPDLKLLHKLADGSYEEARREELDLLVQRTISQLGNLPNISLKDTVADQENHDKQHLFSFSITGGTSVSPGIH